VRRREFIGLVGGAVVAWPLAAQGQQAKVLRVGTAGIQPRTTAIYIAFLRRMAELGYEEGKNFVFEYVQVPNVDGYEEGYREVARRELDIVFTSGPEIALKSAIAAAGPLPIVMVAVDFDPLVRGYVKSLARPTDNLTGIFFQQIELTAKRLQLMKEALPDAQEIHVFWDRISADQWQAAQAAAPNLGLRLIGAEFRDQPYDYERALADMPGGPRRALVVLTSPVFAVPERARLPEFARRHRMASMFSLREYVNVGGLLSYGASFTAMYRHAAEYVVRIAHGTSPRDLPIEQPTQFELVINLKTAKALGITIPQSLLARADEVLE
jgi:putative tryptophan/tyrosine transport system substrate-binding protein